MPGRKEILPWLETDEGEPKVYAAAYRSPPVTSTNNFVSSSSSILTYTTPTGKTGTYSDTVCQPVDRVDQGVNPNLSMHQIVYPCPYPYQPISAPASLAASRENLLENRSNPNSAGQIAVEQSRVAHPDLINGQASGPTSTSRSNSPVKPLQHGNSLSDMVSHPSAANVEQMYPFPIVDTSSFDNMGLNSNSYLMQLDRLEQQHQPLTPYPACKDSMDIYNEHILIS
eukprot:XP_014786577.1 PREDICTED: uncharacterized protein LOC106880918 [Octopus bimaculoides]